MKVTILGCGGSGGVPLADGTPGGNWGLCDPANPRNRRRRCSVLVEVEGRAILIDTSPDLRDQLLDNAVNRVDAVLFTHPHADHLHGLDELRALCNATRRSIPAYIPARNHRELTERFSYAFASSHTGSKLYPALYEDHVVADGKFDLLGLSATAFAQNHGAVDSTGYRIGKIAYSTDAKALNEAAFVALEGIDLWIVDCLRVKPHPTHSHLEQTLQWIERVQPKRAILTHLNHTTDYETLREICPPGVEPAYDGLVVEVD
ncbi:MAG TPA: MBL fold metallo-hydrolase [Kiloniellales bacterium]|nr:MBL fold metallo-hydrolase [Kiloniellales bacterium]